MIAGMTEKQMELHKEVFNMVTKLAGEGHPLQDIAYALYASATGVTSQLLPAIAQAVNANKIQVAGNVPPLKMRNA